MRQHLDLSIDLIDESPANPRQTFRDETVGELAASVRQHGVLIPILVRPHGDRFVVVFGARRLRAARLAQLTTIPAMVESLDDDAASITAVIENLHRENLTPLDEAFSYQELLTARGGKSLDEVAALCGRTKAYIHQRLALTGLVPEVRDLLAGDVLPLSYALKLATVPAERQVEGLALCFSPLFRDAENPFRRELLQPMVVLTNWIKNTVRLNPHSRDTQVLLPELAQQVAAAEDERRASILTVSDLPNHADRTEPLPILRKSWKEADHEEDRCASARPAVIVLGPRKDTFLQVCIDKARCAKHWPKPGASPASDTAVTPQSRARSARDVERERQEESRQQERERWFTIVRPHALRVLAERTVKLPFTTSLIQLVLNDCDADLAEVEEYVGQVAELPSKRWPQALAVAVALASSWSREEFLLVAGELGIELSEGDLSIDVAPVDPAEGPAAGSRRRPAKKDNPQPDALSA